MSEMEMNNEVETEEFADELSDDALDREGGGRFLFLACACHVCGRAGS